ncbi:MAG: sigma-70 family RNA polymerase sigma factor [Bryobacteraceae bacterium]
MTDLYRQHAAAVYRTALRITGRHADAEDVLQTVFLRMLHRGDAMDSARSPEAYLKRAASNAAIDLLRQRASKAETVIDAKDWGRRAQPNESLLLKEGLRQAIARLSTQDAELFILRYIEGLSNIELADLFQLERGTVATRLHRIRQTLQQDVIR